MEWQQWVAAHFYQIIAGISAISGLIGGKLLAPRWIKWLGNRYHAERDLAECRRSSLHREALLEDLIREIQLRTELQDYWESRILNDTTPSETKRRSNLLKPPD